MSSHAHPRQPGIDARAAGLRLLRRTKRWIIGGAVAATGLISLVASQSFHGRAARTTHPPKAVRITSAGSSGGSVASGGS